MKHSTLKTFAVAFQISCILFFAACQSAEVPEVADDATALEIVQLAQTEYDKGNAKGALTYYNILLQRYGLNSSVYVEGRFEIAHIYVKQKKYDLAEPILQEVIGMYDSAQVGVLPGAYKKLAQGDLEKVQAARSGDSAE